MGAIKATVLIMDFLEQDRCCEQGLSLGYLSLR